MPRRIRKGERIPHPRFWETLAALAGTSSDDAPGPPPLGQPTVAGPLDFVQDQGTTSLDPGEQPMSFGQELTFRDCPWCGLRDTHMNTPPTRRQGDAPKQGPPTMVGRQLPTLWGAVLLETNSENETPPRIRQAFPEDERVGTQVEHLPPDVGRFYSDAQRVLDAGVPDASAVQLRKTLEAAAGHFGITDGPLCRTDREADRRRPHHETLRRRSRSRPQTRQRRCSRFRRDRR